MNHINIFNPYRNKNNNHEDELTRNFLILLKNIPLVQAMFFEMIRKEINESKNQNDANIMESFILEDFYLEEIHTQISNSNELFYSETIEGRNLISIIISDDKLETEKKIVSSERKAIYDGVVLCSPSWLFIIENKPSKENIWLNQLDPNIRKNTNISINENPCCLSWRQIILNLGLLIKNNMLIGLEKTFIEDFIEYIDNEYPRINPYTTFELCKDNLSLLNKRCVSIMSKYTNGKEVKYHKGWKSYIESENNVIKKIALDANLNENTKNWKIELWMYAGVTMNSAKLAYQLIDTEKLFVLQKDGFEISEDFHLAYQASNIFYLQSTLSIEEYIKYWKDEYVNLKQVKRDEFNTFIDTNLFPLNESLDFKEKILEKKYPNINICPGFLIKYKWEKKVAIDLERKKLFEKDFFEKVKRVLELF